MRPATASASALPVPLVLALLAVTACCSLLPTVVSAAATPAWVATDYSSCATSLYGESFSSLRRDWTSDTNYPGSTVWLDNGRIDNDDYVEGTGWSCWTNLTGGTLAAQSLCTAAGLTLPALALDQCIPYPSSYFALVYFVVGTPILIAVLLMMHNAHRTALDYRSNEDCVGPGHPLFAQWPFLFDKKHRGHSKYYSSSTRLFWLRHQELEHSFFCFFFISKSDRFSWHSRAFVLLLEQILNLGILCFFTIVVYTNTDGQVKPGSTQGTAQLVAITVVTASALTLLFPVRRLYGPLKRRKHGCVRSAVRAWVVFSVFVYVAVGALSFYFTAAGGKEAGGRARNPGAGLLLYSFLSYVGAIPFHFLFEIVTIWLPLVIPCLPFRFLYVKLTDRYTREFCLDAQGEVCIHDKNAELVKRISMGCERMKSAEVYAVGEDDTADEVPPVPLITAMVAGVAGVALLVDEADTSSPSPLPNQPASPEGGAPNAQQPPQQQQTGAGGARVAPQPSAAAGAHHAPSASTGSLIVPVVSGAAPVAGSSSAHSRTQSAAPAPPRDPSPRPPLNLFDRKGSQTVQTRTAMENWKLQQQQREHPSQQQQKQ